MVHKAEEGKPKCRKCGSGHVDLVKEENKQYLVCLDCGWENVEKENKQLDKREIRKSINILETAKRDVENFQLSWISLAFGLLLGIIANIWWSTIIILEKEFIENHVFIIFVIVSFALGGFFLMTYNLLKSSKRHIQKLEGHIDLGEYLLKK